MACLFTLGVVEAQPTLFHPYSPFHSCPFHSHLLLLVWEGLLLPLAEVLGVPLSDPELLAVSL